MTAGLFWRGTTMTPKAVTKPNATSWSGRMPDHLKPVATIATWLVALLSFLYWLGIIEPLGSRLARETAATAETIEEVDGRVQKTERAILDLQYGIKSIENVNVQLSSIAARLAAIELRIASQTTLKP
jgi:hypothetical protein